MQWIPKLFCKKANLLKKNIDTNKIISRFKKFDKKYPFLMTLGHLSFKTGIPYFYLYNIIARKCKPYHFYKISKRNGGKRNISAPCAGLKYVQQWILKYILNLCEESNYSYAYQSEKTIISCAEQHIGAKWLIKIDIKEFFESLSEIQVYRIFKDIGYTPLLSFQLARLCTVCESDGRLKSTKDFHKYNYWKSNLLKYKINHFYAEEIGHLPQGAPTSPKLANLIVKTMDEKIVNALTAYDITYTRYADDITISSINKMPSRETIRIIVTSVYSIIKMYGLRQNKQKLKVVFPGSKKIVLGLNVEDESLHLSKQFKNNIECHLYFIQKDVQMHIKNRGFDSYLGLKHHVLGLLSYTKQIEPEYYKKLESKKLIPQWEI